MTLDHFSYDKEFSKKEIDIINNYNDADEIAEKIKHLLQNPNAERLAAGIDLESCSWKARSAQLYQKLQDF